MSGLGLSPIELREPVHILVIPKTAGRPLPLHAKTGTYGVPRFSQQKQTLQPKLLKSPGGSKKQTKTATNVFIKDFKKKKKKEESPEKKIYFPFKSTSEQTVRK